MNRSSQLYRLLVSVGSRRGLIPRVTGVYLRDWSLALVGAVILAVLATIDSQTVLLQFPRAVLGFLYVLFVPGYFVTTILFPRVRVIDRIERIGLSIGLSMICVAILSLVLDRLPGGIHAQKVLIGQYSMTAFFIAASLWRRSRLPSGLTHGATRSRSDRRWRIASVTFDRRLSIRLAVGLLVVDVILLVWLASLTFAGSGNQQPATEFYITGSNGLVAEYPYNVGPGGQVSVVVGVVNQDASTATFHVEAWAVDGDVEKRKLLLKTQEFLLPAYGKHEQIMSWGMPWIGNDERVDLLLFYNADAIPSRQLRVWVNTET